MTAVTTVTALDSAARTVTGTVDLGTIPGEASELSIYIDVTAVSGTSPTMTVTYQSSPDGVSFWDNTAGTAMTAASKTLIKVPTVAGKFGRISYVIGGTTPSLTFSAIVEAKRLA